MKENNERRRGYLVDKEFQLNFIMEFLRVEILFTLLIGGLFLIIYYFKYQAGESIFNNYLLIVRKGSSIKVTNMFEIIYPIIIVAGIVITLFTIVYGLIYSHKISGPIYRVKKTIESLGKGIFNFKIKFRKKDKFQDLSIPINELIARLNEKMFIIRGNNFQMSQKIRKMISQLRRSPLNKNQLKVMLEEIDKNNHRISHEIKGMKLSHEPEKLNV